MHFDAGHLSTRLSLVSTNPPLQHRRYIRPTFKNISSSKWSSTITQYIKPYDVLTSYEDESKASYRCLDSSSNAFFITQHIKYCSAWGEAQVKTFHLVCQCRCDYQADIPIQETFSRFSVKAQRGAQCSTAILPR